MMSEQVFEERWIPVTNLTVDERVQRDHLDLRKIIRFKRNFNPAAMGVITVSQRNAATLVIVDGQHRVQVVKELTDANGEVLCHVFKKLTLAEEAQMFLDLNAGTQPSLLDKFKVRLTAGDPVAVEVDALVKSYGWEIKAGSAAGLIQCVGAVTRIYTRSQEREEEPNGLQIAILAVTRAWGNGEQAAVQASILEGIGALHSEYADKLDTSALIQKLKRYKGGPQGLHTDAATLAAVNRTPLSMAVADRLVEEYNKGRQSKALHRWGRRRA